MPRSDPPFIGQSRSGRLDRDSATRRHRPVDCAQRADLRHTSGQPTAVSHSVPDHRNRARTGQSAQRPTEPRPEDAAPQEHPRTRLRQTPSTPNELAIGNCARIPEMLATTPISHPDRDPQGTTTSRRFDGRLTERRLRRGATGRVRLERSYAPRSSNSSPDPITRSRSVLDTSTSFGPASALTRAPMCTAIPPMSSPRTSHSPVCNPARPSMPSACTASRIAIAQRIARCGPSNIARKPSPDVLTSRPRKRASCDRTTASCASSSAC